MNSPWNRAAVWLGERSELKKIASNTGWLAGDRLCRLVIGVFLTGWIARYLGVDQFGRLNYALAFVSLFASVSMLGLDSIVIARLVRSPAEKDTLLCTTFALRLIAGTLSAGLTLFVASYARLEHTTFTLIAALAIGTVFQSFDIIDLYFQSQVNSKWSVLAKNKAFFASALLRVGIVVLRGPLILFAWAIVADIAIGSGMMFTYLSRLRQLPKVWVASVPLALSLLKQSWPLVLSSLSVIIYLRIDQVMLGNMIGSAAVGVYSAAARISELCYFIPTVLASSLLPAILRSRELGEAAYLKRVQKFFDLNTILALAVAIPLCLGAGVATRLLYGSGYPGAADILRVHTWASLFVFMGVARGQYLVSEGHFGFAMAASLAGASSNIALNLLLIPRHGGLGAAIATLVSYGISDLLFSFLYRRTFHIGLMQLNSLVLPLSVRRLLR